MDRISRVVIPGRNKASRMFSETGMAGNYGVPEALRIARKNQEGTI
ncbi:hypothetical protein [Niabella drilacis]|uniref:Uncharacterized protein n=1 Tax=Niabella drilacis (strain DSM 25811 / CCM 8410 / CCUG 62505 / LMG 26954 / E90) TaxID=1285928 RepID=A0A1G6SX37_NIADE|nr:hypothetical protein [Niabella drilacis]SDD21422.1 hypothetical protein SAMN04487894_1076 [Niabella drilacis]